MAAAQEYNFSMMKKEAEIMAHFLPGVVALEMIITVRVFHFGAKLQEGETCAARDRRA